MEKKKEPELVCSICGKPISLNINWVSIGKVYYHRTCYEKELEKKKE